MLELASKRRRTLFKLSNALQLYLGGHDVTLATVYLTGESAPSFPPPPAFPQLSQSEKCQMMPSFNHHVNVYFSRVSFVKVTDLCFETYRFSSR